VQVITNVIPTVSKDKGIYNNLARVINPYGSITLAIACALHLDPFFASYSWFSYSSADVARQLNLNVVASDNKAAPSRSGNSKAFASDSRRVLSRGKSETTTVIKPSRPDLKAVLELVFPPIKISKNPDVTAPNPELKRACLIDLSYHCRLYAITDANRFDEHRKSGRTSEMDYFAHDWSGSEYTSADLIASGIRVVKDDKGNAILVDGKEVEETFHTALWAAFVVVIPISSLKQGFCKALMSVYTISCIPGPPGMNFSVYLAGVRRDSPNIAFHNVVGHWCSTMSLARLKLYNELYQGFPAEVNKVVKAQHKIIRHSTYVKAHVSITNSDEFVMMFARQKNLGNMAIVNMYNPMVNMKDLSADTDATFDGDQLGVSWIGKV